MHYKLVTGDHLDDALAGLSFLKTAPGVDFKRIAIVGHSFGDVITLLSGERDPAVRAEVTFGAEANFLACLERTPEACSRGSRQTRAPIMLIHAANDYDATPGTAIAAELDGLHKPHLLKTYPALGNSPDNGHNLLCRGIREWSPTFFDFSHVKP